jgi:hypothetical protein
MNNKYSTNTVSQRQRIYQWLLAHKSLTTIQARQSLDVLHPAARVQELRAQGHKITTHRTVEDTGHAKHKVACYVLLTEV